MDSWHIPELPSDLVLNGTLRIIDTVSQETYEPINNGQLKMYVCGITPYDSAHVGHLFTYLVFDVMNRVARCLNADVNYVQNITDIDEPLFEKARSIKLPWQNIASEQISNFADAMEFLRVIPPTHFVSVTEEIQIIIQTVEMMEKLTYEHLDTTYFQSSSDDLIEFTGLDKNRLIELSRARGGDPDLVGKHDALDPKVWIPSLADEPSWTTKYGVGRPGWHIECIAIARKYLGGTFDMQGGGQDLIFPHHAFCDQMFAHLFNQPLTRGFMHIQLVEYQGEKMSKSLGNLVFLSDLIDAGATANVIRLSLLSNNWTKAWEFNFGMVDSAKSQFEDLRNSFKKLVLPPYAKCIDLVETLLLNNLNISAFINNLIEIERIEVSAKESLQVRNLLMALLGIDLLVD